MQPDVIIDTTCAGEGEPKIAVLPTLFRHILGGFDND